ncbi:MAG: DNA-3-methyladenine glycosylase [Chthoniobacterales bacterium]|nr:DNA-3-methyladenine glycosylase [Chthoniobacterales bacterium]
MSGGRRPRSFPTPGSGGVELVPSSFFQRDPLRCARELVGTVLLWGGCAGIVVETEAYFALDDEACHTFFRPSTRAFVERNPVGAAYIYLNYGVHWMLNVLVKDGEADGFVLIRALQPTEGIELMKRRRGSDEVRRLCSGPGKLTQALEITNRDHERNLCADPAHCFNFVADGAIQVVADERVGITKAAHRPWRFTLRGSSFVSRPVKRRMGRIGRMGHMSRIGPKA